MQQTVCMKTSHPLPCIKPKLYDKRLMKFRWRIMAVCTKNFTFFQDRFFRTGSLAKQISQSVLRGTIPILILSPSCLSTACFSSGNHGIRSRFLMPLTPYERVLDAPGKAENSTRILLTKLMLPVSHFYTLHVSGTISAFSSSQQTD